MALALASTVLSVMYIESGDVARSADTAERAAKEIEAAGLEGTDEHIRLRSTLVSALIERGDLLHATRRVEQLIEVADRVGQLPRPRCRSTGTPPRWHRVAVGSRTR